MENVQGHEMGREKREPSQQRRQHRTNEFYHRASEAMGLPRDSGRNVAQSILRNVVKRVTPEEAKHLIAQLPQGLQEDCLTFADGPQKSVTAEKIKRDILNASDIEGMDPASCARVFWHFLSSWLNEEENKGETQDILGQLPSDIRELFTSDIKH